MKKYFLILNLLLVSANIAYFLMNTPGSDSTHSVSESFAHVETVTDSTEELVSVGYATINKREADTLKSIFPNLKIAGDLEKGRMELIEKVLFTMPADKLQNFYTLHITQVKGQTRGLGGANTVIINDYNLSDEEFVSVLVHEIGHVIDLGGIQGNPTSQKSPFNDGSNPIYANDFSTLYYAYSWNDSKQKKGSANHLDFVSGYAMTDPFEDFAESFAYYFLHNDDFKVLAKDNEKLAMKYSYIRDYIFDGQELQTGEGSANSNKRVWDITKLSIQI